MPVFGKAVSPSVLAKVANQATPPVIRAYHGSPYDFDKFDASKIGTGEGAQAYGHGLYFAGNEKVAIDYRDRLKDLVDGPIPDELGNELQAAIQEIRQLAERQRAIGSPVGFSGVKTPDSNEWHAIQKQLDDAHLRHQDIQHRIREASYNPGRMYEVELGVPEYSMLDWDQPVESQADSVRSAVTRLLGDDQVSGQYAYRELEQNMGSPRSASETLKAVGVPGIRYFDGGSRRLGEGTRNYVMFPGTEDSIRILRKYGLLGPAAVGAMQQDETP